MSQYSIKVLYSHFIKSANTLSESIPAQYSEIAILGRSNVGKSSFINMLLNQKLAKSSSTPGKTKLINFFATTLQISECKTITQQHNATTSHNPINYEALLTNLGNQNNIPLVIIDFPGFGYAKVDKKTRNIWDKNLTHFLQNRHTIKLFCHLIDSRHTNLEIDSQILSFLEHIIQTRKDCQILQIYTKDDKLKKNELIKLHRDGKLTISTLKKNPHSLQILYHTLLCKCLGI